MKRRHDRVDAPFPALIAAEGMAGVIGRRRGSPEGLPRSQQGATRARAMRVAAGLSGVAVMFVTTPGRTEPQLSTSVQLGVSGAGNRSALWSDTYFMGGLRAELLLGRDRDASFGVGPYVEGLTTTGFSDVQLGGGASFLVPVHEYLPIVLSAGGYAGQRAGAGWQPGLAAEIFWGTHGYNFHSFYSLSAGIIAATRYGLGDAKDVTLLGGARIDLEFIAIPFMLAWGAIRGGNPAR